MHLIATFSLVSVAYALVGLGVFATVRTLLDQPSSDIDWDALLVDGTRD